MQESYKTEEASHKQYSLRFLGDFIKAHATEEGHTKNVFFPNSEEASEEYLQVRTRT